MRTHQFSLDPHRSDRANVLLIRAYVRKRFGKKPQSAKGRALTQKRLTGKSWNRFS